MGMQIRNRRTVAIGAGAAVVAALIVGTIVWAVQPRTDASPAPSETASATPSPTPTPVVMPEAVPVYGSLNGWTTPDTTTIGRVLPEVGAAADGRMSAVVDAPAVDGQIAALSVDVPLKPGSAYEVSFSARVESTTSTTVPAALRIGDHETALPKLDASWTTVEDTFTAPAGADSATLALVLTGPVNDLGIDDIVVRAKGGDNVVPNPSFEDVSASGLIVNRSLILPGDRAALAVQLAQGDATWTAVDEAGATAAGGTASLRGGVDILPLEGLTQGYYTVTVSDADGTSISAPVAVIDYEGASIAKDDRFGTSLHLEKDWYADGADAASALGIGLARNDILWRLNETTPGVYDWDPTYATRFDRLHAQGVHLLGIVNYGNKLYGSDKLPDNDEAVAAYGRYAAAIAQRFDLAGLEVFNEFNHARFNKSACGTAPECYMPLLKSVHDSVRAVDPDLPIVAGSTALYESDWFTGLWRAGGMDYSDAMSYHPYVGSSDLLKDIVLQSRTDMTSTAGREIPIWITEFGFTSASMTPAQQAVEVFKSATSTLGNGVAKFFWYDLINDSPDGSDHEGNFGLYGQSIDGVAALPPKKAAFVYGLLIEQLGGLKAAGEANLGGGATGYTFGAGDDAVTAAWAGEGGATVEIPTDHDLEVITTDGASTVVSPAKGVASVTVPQGGAFIRSAPTS